jgi:photosystem II stability/assembly factor-like uncharacterized protein
MKPTVRRRSLALVAATLLYAGVSPGTSSGPEEPVRGPRAPRVDEKTYLKKRDEHLATLRGLPWIGRANPRLAAIREMERPTRLRALGEMASWTPIGPAPIPNGQTVPSAAVSGRVTAIVVHPSDAGKAYVGTAQGGVFRTLDGGATWTPIFDGALSLAVGALALDPGDPTRLLVGTGEPNTSPDSFFGVGLYVVTTAEGGAALHGPFGSDGTGDVLGGRSITRILVDPADRNVVFISTASGYGGVDGSSKSGLPDRGIYRSTNALSANPTFTKLAVPSANGGNRAVTDTVLEPGDPSHLVVAVLGTDTPNDGGLWRSTNALDASPTFSRVMSFGADFVRASLAVQKTGAVVTVFALSSELPPAGDCAAAGEAGRLHKSTDGGATWPAVVPAADGICGGVCLYSQALAVDPGDPGKLYLGGNAPGTCSSIFKKSSDGVAFASSAASLHAYSHVLAVAPSDPSVLWAGNDGGIFRSTDSGASWVSRNTSGFNATLFGSVALHPADPFFTLGGAQGHGTNLLSPSGAWSRVDYGDGGAVLIDSGAADTSLVTMYHTYFNTVDGGLPGAGLVGLARVRKTSCAADGEWVFRGCSAGDASMGCEGAPRGAANGLSCSDSAVLFFAPMTLGPGGPGAASTLYFGTDRLYRSADRGDTMVPVSQAFEPGVPVSAIGVAPQDDAVRVARLKSGRVFATSGGSPMREVTGPWPRAYVARAAVTPGDSKTAYVTLSGFGLPAGQHVWKTVNLDAASPTWTPSGTGIPDVPVNAFAIEPLNAKHLYAGTDIGVFYSSDAGASWVVLGTGLPRVPVFDIAFQNANRVVRIATHGRGIWELTAPVPVELTSFNAN